MRTLKFRMFINGKMLYPPFNFFTTDGEMKTQLHGLEIPNEGGVEQADGVLMQFTDQKLGDKELWEDDLLSLTSKKRPDKKFKVHRVVWQADKGRWAVDDGKQVSSLARILTSSDRWEIVGNAHENKDLLNK